MFFYYFVDLTGANPELHMWLNYRFTVNLWPHLGHCWTKPEKDTERPPTIQPWSFLD